MKFRYLIGALLLGLGIVSACTEEESLTLSELQVSESYVSLEVGGSTSSIKVTAIEDWSVVAESVPEWLTVSPMSGAAGETTLSFTAGATTATRSAEVKLLSNAKNQYINVIQYAEKVEPKMSTVAEVLAGADGDVFRVKGVCTTYNTGDANAVLYGNWYITDDTGTVYIYGTLNKAGQTKGNPLTDWGIEVGDMVTVEGPRSTYGTTVELVDVAVLAVEKSLIGVDSVELLGVEEGEGVTEFPLDGGSIKVTLSVKGDGFRVVIPEEAKSWLHIDDFDSSSVTLKADKNEGGDRAVEVTFSTEKDDKTYTCVQAFTQKGAILEVSIAEFLAAEVGDTQYRLTGLIISEYAADKQGQSFTIRDWSGEVLVYRLNDYKASGAKVDDIITVVGKRGAYGETKQMVSGVYESHIPVTTVTIADFITKPDDKPADNHVGTYYKVTGTITSLKNNKGQDNDYGNLYISDGTNEIYLYGLYAGWGASGDARKGFVKAQGIEVGDVLTSIGYKDTYSGLIELCGGIYVSHEKGQSGGIKIDGDLSDWDEIAALPSSQNSRIREWKFTSDANNVYFYFKIRKNRAYYKPLYIGFDTDNNESTGASYDNGKINGLESQIEAYPFTNTSSGVEPVVKSGVDQESWAKAGEVLTEKIVTIAGYDAGEDVGSDSSNTYIEISVPRSALNLTSGTTVSIGCAFDWYVTGKQSLAIQ